MLKEAPCMVGRTVARPNLFRLDGLILFCIIMGYASRAASSAKNMQLSHKTATKEFVNWVDVRCVGKVNASDY